MIVVYMFQTLLCELRVLCKSMSDAPPTSYTHTSGEYFPLKSVECLIVKLLFL